MRTELGFRVCTVAIAAVLLGTAVATDAAAQETLIGEGDTWSFFRGRSEPPPTWIDHDFDVIDNGWEEGPSGIGYGDDDDATVLADMQDGYVSVYARRPFEVPEGGAGGVLVLRVRYDDAFIAYIDGREVTRRGMLGVSPPFDQLADVEHEISGPTGFDEEIILELPLDDLIPGAAHVLAAQVHNATLASSDLSFSAELVTAPFWVESVSPPFGPVEGGNSVDLIGRGFDPLDPPTVTFGGVASPDVGVEDDRLTVAVPPAAFAGVVDVVVEDARGQVVLPGAYRYAEPGRFGLLFDGDQWTIAAGLEGLLEEGTVQLWIRRTDDGFFNFFYRTLLSFESLDGEDEFRLDVRAGNIRARTIVGGEQQDLVAGVDVGSATWHHIAYTFSSGGRQIFFDGELVAQDANGVDHSEVNRLRLGAGVASGGLAGAYRGTIESVGIWPFERLPADIRDQRFTPVGEQDDVDVAWPMDEGLGQTSRDEGPFDIGLVLGASTGAEAEDPQWVEITDFPGVAITRVVPGSGPLAGGNRVTIFGGGFVEDDTSVRFAGRESPDVEVLSAGELTAEVPAGPRVGPATVNVRTSRGTATLAAGYLYERDDLWLVVAEGDEWDFRVGDAPPPADWNLLQFRPADADWERGPSGLGYGDDDDATEILGIQNLAWTLYARREWTMGGGGANVEHLELRVRWDDGFVAYLNGVEVARRNMTGTPPTFDEPANAQHEILGGAGTFDEAIDITVDRGALRAGRNVLAIEVHNATIDSSDLSLSAELILAAPGTAFVRGDVDGDGAHSVSDAVNIVLHAFRGRDIDCLEAADVDDDGRIALGDAAALLDWVFRRGTPPPAPLEVPRPDLDDDPLDCSGSGA